MCPILGYAAVSSQLVQTDETAFLTAGLGLSDFKSAAQQVTDRAPATVWSFIELVATTAAIGGLLRGRADVILRCCEELLHAGARVVDEDAERVALGVDAICKPPDARNRRLGLDHFAATGDNTGDRVLD